MGGFGGGMGMGVSGMSDYSSDFDGFNMGMSNPAGNMPGGNRMSELTPAEREFLGARNRGRGRGGFGVAAAARGFGGNASMQGRKLRISGLTAEVTDQMICRYFRKFGVVDDWNRSKCGEYGNLTFTESYMVGYCIKRPSHQIDGHIVAVSRVEPVFDNDDDDGEQGNNDNGNGADMDADTQVKSEVD